VSRLSALRERNFRRFLIGQATSLLGDSMALIALAFAVLGLTHSAGDLSLVIAARTIPLIAFMVFGGVLADRLPRKAVMVGADVVRFGCQGVLAVLLLTGHPSVWAIAALMFVHGCGSALFTPALTGLVRETVSTEHLQDANALRGFVQSGAQIAGPALAGLLIAGAGAGWAIALDAATFAISAIFLAGLKLPPKPVPATGMLTDLAEGWREFAARRWVWSFVGAASVSNMWQAALHVLGPVAAIAFLGGARGWGLVLAAGGVGALVGGALSLAVRPAHPLLAAVRWDLVFAVQLLCLALGTPLYVMAPAAFLAGVSLMVSNTLWETTLQQNVPAAALSRVSSYEWVGCYGGYSIGLLAVPLLYTGVGLHATLWIGCLAQFGSAACLLLVRDVRRMTRTAPEPEPDLCSSTPVSNDSDRR
jgi:MFS family permease